MLRVRADVRPVTALDLSPGPGLSPGGGGFAVAAPHVRLTAAVPLPVGWYEVRLGASSADKFAVRKRLELTCDSGDGDPRPPAREAFSWNRSFAERFMVRLTRPAAGVRLDVWHAEGGLTLDAFSVRRVRRAGVVAKAVREKVRLTRTYRCFGPALVRGGKLLWAGRFRDFGAKLVGGLSDTRSMQLGAVAAAEVNGAWSGRHALSADEADRVRGLIDGMSDPVPVTVILPVESERLDPARASALSVRRQLYPHWQLIVAAAGGADLDQHLENLAGTDPRASVVRVGKWAGRAAAIAEALARAESGRVVILPPTVELAEHALYHLAAAVKENPDSGPIGVAVSAPFPGQVGRGDRAGGGTVWLVDARRIKGDAPGVPAVDRIGDWVLAGETGTVLDGVLAYPSDHRPLAETARVGVAEAVEGSPLHLLADVRGVSGYDHLTYALLHGLPSAGAELLRHRNSVVRRDLVPPELMPPVRARRPGEPMLVAGPPFLFSNVPLDSAAAMFTMWETDRLDPKWVARLNTAGLVIVPSQWQADCFRADGVTVPIEIAPLGFDPVVFHPAGPPPAVCTFGTAGSLSAGGVRKNAQWVLDVFRRAFPTEPDVRLRVKTTPGSPGVETYDDPRVDVVRAVLPHRELADWYRSLTAYVNGSSCEGFGLHLIEAMACGRPLVTPAYSGLTAFFASDLGYAVDYRLVPVRNEIYAGHWAEPSVESMVAQLRAVHADPARAAALGERSAVRATSFTWKSAGRQLAAALRKHNILSD